MSNTGGDSPDWLRSFQAPNISVTALSSDSEPSGDKRTVKYEKDGEQDDDASDTVMQSDVNKSSHKTAKKLAKVSKEVPAKKRKAEKHKNSGSEDDGDVEEENEKTETPAPNQLIWALSSDSESNAEFSMEKEEVKEESSSHQSLELLNKEEKDDNATTTPKAAIKQKSPKKRLKTENHKTTEKEKTNDNGEIKGEGGDMDAPEEADEGIPEKNVESRISSSRMPLILPEKVHRFKALVECEGESIDLRGDMGAVGRVMISENPSKEPEMFLDLKGTIYKTTIVPSRTFCVVSIGQSEAKIEAIMNDFIQLAPQSNVYDAETMVEGTLDGFSFDSEDEAEKTNKDTKGDQAEGGEEKTKTKPKGKGKTEKKSGGMQKKGKATGGKQPKKRKPQASKKGKTKK